MWPFFVLFNKILKIEEGERVHISDGNQAVLDCSPSKQSSSLGKCSHSVLPRAHFVDVPYVTQLFTWDCGLACVLMVLRMFGVNNYDIQGLADMCCTTSIWTVDLAYLLQRFKVKFSYFTVTFGANPSYSGETFYKEQLPTDLVRVDTLFQKAMEAGINIECRSFSSMEISHMILSGKYIAIALVDQYKLSRSWVEEVIFSGFYGNEAAGYTGHYIVICGYDADADEFEIRDPASSRKQERVSSKRLDEARKSFGTDEDILLLSLDLKRDPAEFCPASHLVN